MEAVENETWAQNENKRQTPKIVLHSMIVNNFTTLS